MCLLNSVTSEFSKCLDKLIKNNETNFMSSKCILADLKGIVDNVFSSLSKKYTSKSIPKLDFVLQPTTHKLIGKHHIQMYKFPPKNFCNLDKQCEMLVVCHSCLLILLFVVFLYICYNTEDCYFVCC